jgi:hypothetical protein
MIALLRKISGSGMNRAYKAHETHESHSLRSLRKYFVRENCGSFVVAKAAASEEIIDNNNRSRWFGGKRSRRMRSGEGNWIGRRYL